MSGVIPQTIWMVRRRGAELSRSVSVEEKPVSESVVKAQLKQSVERGYLAAFRILGNKDSAIEACQEAAYRALKASHQYDDSKPFYPWFYRILKNHCFDLLKSRRPQLERQTKLTQYERQTKATANAEQRLIKSDRERAVVRAIESLPDDLREIIELRHFQDLSYETIADILSCPLGTVMSRLYRARKTMRNTLLKDSSFDPPQDATVGRKA